MEEKNATLLYLREQPNYTTNGLINFMTFHFAGHYGSPQRIIAAFYREVVKEMEGGLETVFNCQFAYCSPREKSSNKFRGQEVAYRRLIDNGPRGFVSFALPGGFTHNDLRNSLKEKACSVAQRKKITWLRGLVPDALV